MYQLTFVMAMRQLICDVEGIQCLSTWSAKQFKKLQNIWSRSHDTLPISHLGNNSLTIWQDTEGEGVAINAVVVLIILAKDSLGLTFISSTI